MLLGLLLSACVSKTVGFEPASLPVDPTNIDSASGHWVDMKQCRHWLFGFIPIREKENDGVPFNTGYLIREATSRNEVLLGANIDQEYAFWLLGWSDCRRLTGYAVFLPPPGA